jgi:thioredoxin-like negative regulator of GroEL
MSERLATDPELLSSRIRNLVVAVAALVLSVAMVLGLRAQSTAPSLTALAASSVPYEVAQTNGKPTLLEFYANWCATCQAMAGDMAALRQGYGDRVNFVMLNIDNNTWLSEMLAYRVEGIPHFVYLGATGDPIAAAIGEQPRQILAENLDALIAQVPLPHLQAFGRRSELEDGFLARQQGINDDPRSVRLNKSL